VREVVGKPKLIVEAAPLEVVLDLQLVSAFAEDPRCEVVFHPSAGCANGVRPGKVLATATAPRKLARVLENK
jgi:hypothetical protein